MLKATKDTLHVVTGDKPAKAQPVAQPAAAPPKAPATRTEPLELKQLAASMRQLAATMQDLAKQQQHPAPAPKPAHITGKAQVHRDSEGRMDTIVFSFTKEGE